MEESSDLVEWWEGWVGHANLFAIVVPVFLGARRQTVYDKPFAVYMYATRHIGSTPTFKLVTLLCGK
eukprot:scaffold5156_cov87-Amphora_coffeaeformis.AAC.1